MKNRTIIQTLGIILICTMYIRCSKDDVQAENSIKGNWEIKAITSIYGDFFENGFNPSESISESGQLGTFNFTEDSVKFNFKRNDTIYSGSSTWTLLHENVRDGFTRDSEFELTIENHFQFNVLFENGTHNSEKNAKKVSFITKNPIGLGVSIEISMKKK